MKGFVAPLIPFFAFAILTMFGFIPAFLGVPAMIIVVLVRDTIFAMLARGLPMAMISIRAAGGMLWGVMEKTGNIIAAKKNPIAGMVFTKEKGAYNVVSEGMFKLDGVPICVAPEEIGFNPKIEHLQLIGELKKRGIMNILEVIDVNDQGQFLGWKDDPRIADLKVKYATLPQLINFPGLNDFHRYAIESAHPFRQDANVKIGIARGTQSPKERSPWIWVAVIMAIGFFGIMALYMLTQGNKEVIVLVDNARQVIPA